MMNVASRYSTALSDATEEIGTCDDAGSTSLRVDPAQRGRQKETLEKTPRTSVVPIHLGAQGLVSLCSFVTG